VARAEIDGDTLERREHATCKGRRKVVQDPREGVFTAINDAHAVLKRLRSVTETSGTYRRHAFYESASYLSLQLALALERSWTAIECLLEELPE
jgi:hypothetical protein